MSRRPEPKRAPRALAERGLYVVDGSWGTIQPMELAAGVRTVGELDVCEQIEAGRPLVDTRPPESYAALTIPTAINLPHREAAERIAELDASVPTVFFCNGPLCSATPAMVRTLLDAGYPADAILYYRGGLHDWVTVGLPVERHDGAP